MFVLLLLLHCFIFILVLLLCCVSRSSLYCNIPSDCVLCVCLVITSTLFYLYTCTVVMLCIQIIYFTVIYLQIVYSVFVLLLLLHCFIFILVLLLCCVSDHLLYCNIPSDCVLCVCLVITSTLFYLYHLSSLKYFKHIEVQS